MTRGVAAALVAASLSSTAFAAPSQIDYSKSKIVATSKQMNVPMDGTFKKFSAQIDYDPAHPAAGTANLTIQIASFDLGDETYNKQTRDKEWFDASTFPNATFVSSSISPGATGTLTVSGTLTIKGKSQKVSLPVKVATQAGTTTFDGVFPIKRSVFAIGTGVWKDTSIVADDVSIKFHIVEIPKK